MIQANFYVILDSSLKLYFRWHDVKKEEICDLMENIWIKKELYFSSYELLKYLTFFWILIWFFK